MRQRLRHLAGHARLTAQKRAPDGYAVRGRFDSLCYSAVMFAVGGSSGTSTSALGSPRKVNL
ncbi:MAG: hypothetical protein ABJA34_14505, partial [Pseudonocardiales bacterium]